MLRLQVMPPCTGAAMMLQLVIWLQIMTAILTRSSVSGLEISLSNREGFERASSCRHSVARIEITNTDDHDCLIRSIRLGPETTVQVEPFPILSSEAMYELPQQFYAADLDERALTLAPGQVAAMPLPLLPRFPPRWESAADHLSPHLNVWQRADRQEFLKSFALRSNLHLAQAYTGTTSPTLEEYRISSSFLVESETHGIQSMAIEAKSVRNNPFGLPDSIYFRGDLGEKNGTNQMQAPVSEAPNFVSDNGMRILNRIWNWNEHTSNERHPDCYDIYVRHPGEQGLIDAREPWLIWSVVVSHPDKASLYLSPQHLGIAGDFVDSARHVIDTWGPDDQDHRVIPPDGQPHYLATVCPTPAREINESMGEKVKKSFKHWITSTLSDDSLGFVIIQSDAPVLMTELIIKRSNERSSEVDSLLTDMDFANETSETTTTMPLLRSNVENIDIYCLFSTGAVSGDITVSIHNTASHDVTIIGASLVFRDNPARKMLKKGINVTLHPVFADDKKWHIASEATQPIAKISTTVDTKKSKSIHGSYTTTGRILIQGSFSHSARESWLHEVRADPGLDIDALVEIPITVHISEGKIGFQLNYIDRDDTLLAMSGDPGEAMTVKNAFFPLSLAGLSASGAIRKGIKPTTIHHYFEVFSTIPDHALELFSARIVDNAGRSSALPPSSGCLLFDVSLSKARNITEVTEEISSNAIGGVFLVYTFPNQSGIDADKLNSPLFCNLLVETEPDTGEHLLPLTLYSGDLIASDQHLLGFSFNDEMVQLPSRPSMRGKVLSGSDEISIWMSDSPEGKSFDSFLRTIRRCNNAKYSSLEDRLCALLGSTGGGDTKIRPVLVDVGTVNAGETEVFPLQLKNPNPVPVTVSLAGTNIDGFNLRLARDRIVSSGEGQSLSEVILQTWTKTKALLIQDSAVSSTDRIRGQRLESLFHFLKTSKIPRTFLDEFIYRDAMYIDRATADMFQPAGLGRKAVSFATFHRNPWPTNGSSPICCTSDSDTSRSVDVVGPGLLATGTGRFDKRCRCGNTKVPSITIPAAGIARFDVTVTAPPESALERDINSFVATGMVISTDHGMSMPILVSFNVPRGSLILSPFSKERSKSDTDSPHIITADAVGAYFKNNHSSSPSEILIPSRTRSQLRIDSLLGHDGLSFDYASPKPGQAIYARSSFNRDLKLIEIRSCNSWFQVDLNQNSNASEVDAFLGVNIGALRHEVPCDNSATQPDFHSFHGCVLNWISKWQGLQKSGCGSSGVKENAAGLLQGRYRRSIAKAHNRMLQLSAWSFSSHKDLSNPARFFDGYLAPSVVTIAAEIWNLWRKVHKWDMFIMSTDLHAKVLCNSSDDGSVETFSLPIRNVSIISKLVPPSLIDTERIKTEPPKDPFGPHTIETPSALVGTPVSIMIPLYNPTNVPVRVRLATVLPEEVEEEEEDNFYLDQDTRSEYCSSEHPPYIQGPLYSELGVDQVNQQWWDGAGSFFFPNFNGDLVRANHNVSVRAGSDAYVGLVSPSLLSNSAFLYGCGQRCGIRDEPVSDDAAKNTQRRTMIGAASSIGAVLAGRGRGETAEDNEPLGPFDDLSFTAGSSIHSDRLGPTAYGIPRSALEEIVIEPHGTAEIGPIYFRPPGRHPRIGDEDNPCPDDCDTFDSMVFLENSMTGVEPVALKGRALWEKVEFTDTFPEEGEESVSDIELRNGMDTLLFPGTLLPPFPSSSAVLKEIKVRNVGDTPVSFHLAYLSDGVTPVELKDANRFCFLADFHLLNCSLEGTFWPVSFGPGETISIFVSHRPTCTKQSDFISLKIEYGIDDEGSESRQLRHTNPSWRTSRASQRKWSFRRKSEVLMVGYDMDKVTFPFCVPSNTNLFQFLPGQPALLTPVNQTRGLRDLSKSVNDLETATTRSKIPKIVSLLFGTTLCLVVIAGMVFAFQNRRIATNALKEHAGKSRIAPRQGGARKPGTLLRTAAQDLTQAEFEAFGHEHVRRQLVLRSPGKHWPQCISPTGAFQRDRSQVLAAQASTAKDRTRTISEILFQGIANDQLHGGMVPLNMGWRAAVARGITSEKSFRKIQGQLETHHLLVMRSRQPKPVAKHPATESINNVEKQMPDRENREGDTVPESNTGMPDETQDEIGSPSLDLASEESDVEISLSEASPNGGSEHKSSDVSRHSSVSPEVEDVVVEDADIQKEPKDGGFKTIRTDKGGKGRSRKGSSKKHSPGTMEKNGSAKKDRNARSNNRKMSLAEDRRTGSDRSSPMPSPASLHGPSTDGRGWAQVAALSHGPDMPLLRPPPGLGPPPGFPSHHLPVSPESLPSSPPQPNDDFALDYSGGLGELLPRDRQQHHSSAASETSSNSGEYNMHVSHSPVMTPSYLSRDNSVDQLPSLGMFWGDTFPSTAPESQSATPDEFDVLDFLDGILNDGSSHHHEAPEDFSAAPANAAAAPVGLSTDPIVPANPWAGGSDAVVAATTSRASLYGIALNDSNGMQDSALDFPLLTPQVILDGVVDYEKEEEEEDLVGSPLFARIHKQQEE